MIDFSMQDAVRTLAQAIASHGCFPRFQRPQAEQLYSLPSA